MSSIDRNDPGFEALVVAIAKARTVGKFTVEMATFQDQNAARARMALLARLGFRDLGGLWLRIDVDRALAVLEGVLHKGLAYDSEVMEPAIAAELAGRFVHHLGPGDWLTNGGYALSHAAPPPRTASGVPIEVAVNGWNPISSATFDAGVVFVGRDRVAIAWAEDED